MPPLMLTETHIVTGLTNAEFLHAHARAGRIGLAGGVTVLDKMIGRAQRHVDDQHRWSQWSHAFFFQDPRADGHHWVMESDMEIHRKHVRFGVQENRITKYHDDSFYTNLAVLDFGVADEQIQAMVRVGLDLVAARCRYSVRELVGTLIVLRNAEKRARGNPLDRRDCFYCSAFVSHLFREAGIDLAPGLPVKNITPEDICRALVPHRMWVLQRETLESSLKKVRAGVKARVGAAVRRLKKNRL